MKRSLILLLGLHLMNTGCGPDPASTPPSPEAMLETFRISEEFRVEIFAAEPDVTDPVDLAFDEQGRAWVAEMRDYPYQPPEGGPFLSRVRVLEDRDGDGRVDHSTVFAEGLPNVKSVLPWKDGLLVSSAPNILYLRDTDGDLRADETTPLFTGFTILVDPEGQLSNLRFGIDNWIYAANDSQAGQITFSRRPGAEPVSVLNADFRFRLDRNLFEAASGATRFGLSFDEWGRRFFSQSGRHIQHVVAARRYLQRNLFLTAPPVTRFISVHDQRIFQLTPAEAWREARTRMRRRRARELGRERQTASTGFFSGATGATIYTGDTFPRRYRGNAFAGDVAGNIVHRDVLTPSGVSFVADRPEEERDREFMASTSRWFRPASFAVGPDGNLYVVDICRQYVETPASIPEPIKEGLDFYAGIDHGRIYRIVPRDSASRPYVRPELHKAATPELVGHLASPNQWWRLTAQRLLLQRQDRSALPALREMAGNRENPQGRLHALFALEGLSALEEAIVGEALEDDQPGVREQAVILAEKFPGLLPKLVKMTGDPSPRVAFQLSLSLGEFSGPRVHDAFRDLVARHGEDPWQRAAVLSSDAGSSLKLLQSMVAERGYFNPPAPNKTGFLDDLAAVVGARSEGREVQRLVRLLARSRPLREKGLRAAGLSGLARGLELAQIVRLNPAGAAGSLRSLLGSGSQEVRDAAARVGKHFRVPSLVATARKDVLDESLSAARRSSSVRMLAAATYREAEPVLTRVLTVADPELTRAALETLSYFEDPDVSRLVLEKWGTFSPDARAQALAILLSHPARVQALLSAVESGAMERAALDHQQKQFLRNHPGEEVRRRALEILQADTTDRDALVEEHLPVLELEADPLNGGKVFRRECARCHEPDQGVGVGPGLRTAVQGHTREQLLFDILNPSGLILSAYQNYIVTTRDGRVYGGIIAAETPGTLTLRSGPNQQETILRGRIAEIRASEVSIMPEGFEENLTRQELADVISFMQAGYLIPEELAAPRDN
ncbi:MAG: c-type cytochrome [Acidobacteriota bacterium]|nr:c-type cytochrome [Acidobacteriota bacterium]